MCKTHIKCEIYPYLAKTISKLPPILLENLKKKIAEGFLK